MSKQYDLIVFDWDGTLMDSTAHITHAIQQACRDLQLPVPSRQQASHVIGLRLAEAMQQACPQASPAQLSQLGETFRRHYLANQDQVSLFEGAVECLHAIRASGALLAVATGNSRAGLNRLLDATGLAPLFDATRTVDECHSKPHPDMLQQISDVLGVELKRTLMVGDTSHDLLMANNAGCHGVGVSYGAHAIEHLAGCQPRAIVHSCHELSAWLLPKLG